MKNHLQQIHIMVNTGRTLMVADPDKYKGRGRPRKRDYVPYWELIDRAIFQPRDYLESLI